MGRLADAEIDVWLRGGGLVVTASDRAARSIASAFHRARLAEGLTAWAAPNIVDWNGFIRTEWMDLGGGDGRLLLNPVQEQALWAEVAGRHNHVATLLEGPRHRLASLAMDANELLCDYAPHLLRASARSGWQQDAGAFSEWLTAFDENCRANELLSPARLPLELIPVLESATSKQASRAPLLLAGFDRILPTQRRVLDAWGSWRQVESGEPTVHIRYHEAPDAKAELAACALWCGRRLAANPNARLLIVTQDAADRARRGQIERAFLKYTASMQNRSANSPLFEFSLGIPLGQIGLPKAAFLLLRWLSAPLAEHELDWLFSTGYVAASQQESTALQTQMRALRRRARQQLEWTLKAFIAASYDFAIEDRLPRAWVNRISEAQRGLDELARRPQIPVDWVELVPQLLSTSGFPGTNSLSSTEYQAADRWRQALETCASLGFDGRRIPWKDFLSALGRTVDETLFVPESRDAPIQITGPAESAGLTADGVWFLGANEEAWPAGGATHPLLPLDVQREARMPHANPQLDWELARAITTRLISSAPEVHFSCAKQVASTEFRPSRLVSKLAGAPQPLPPELTLPASPPPLTIAFEDFSRIPFAPGKVHGGASVLTMQSQCPFKAFATARLGAQNWEPAETGLTAAQRGQLLHAALHAIWAGPPKGIRSHQQLLQLKEREEFVAGHVHRALQNGLGSELRERMPRRYLELEEQRLTGLLTEWLEFETSRVEFEVTDTEAGRPIHIAGLDFDLRLDRIDRLNDGSLLVIDYKSGDVSPKSWDLPRPDDVQLPLYAGFALDGDEEVLGGLVFAKVRAGNHAFAGRVGDAKSTLHANLSGSSGLIKDSLTAELLIDWRAYVEQLAKDFLAGRAEVDPREYPKTCEHCGLQTLCRIQESQSLIEAEENTESEEDADE
jgi:ATP-dependent helicase/nuclease subunit B